MEEKYAKAIANELKLIRQELQKLNEPKVVGPLVFQQAPMPQEEEPEEETFKNEVNLSAGSRVSF